VQNCGFNSIKLLLIMLTATRHCCTIVAASLLVFGCSTSERALDTKPEGTRLSPRMVIEIAKQFSETNRINLGNFKSPTFGCGDKHLGDPGTKFGDQSIKGKIWMVHFEGRVPTVGNYFDVFVDDQTGETLIFGGR
jgi:hypothetical protein